MLERTPDGERSGPTLCEQQTLTPITMKNLSYVADGKTLLDRVTFEIPSTGKTVIMGANGAGKSLLLRILNGLLKPTSGAILWNNAPAGDDTYSKQAMVFQKPILLRRSAAQNISFVLKNLKKTERQAKALAILSKAGLLQVADTPARLLSGGEQQRLAIARALATAPKILFLDEPTAGLDPASTFKVECLIEKAAQTGTKIVFVTHDIAQARRLADDIAFLSHGQVVETALAEKFFQHPAHPAAKAYLAGELYLKESEKAGIAPRTRTDL